MRRMRAASADTVAISRIRLQATEALKQRLAQGPVIVQRQGKAVAVLLDPARWQELADRLEPDAVPRTNNRPRRR